MEGTQFGWVGCGEGEMTEKAIEWQLECDCKCIMLRGTSAIAVYGFIRCGACGAVNRVELNWPDMKLAAVRVT